MPQGQAVLAQLLLQPRPGRAGLDPRRQRDRLDLEHPIPAPPIHRHHPPLPPPRLDPAHAPTRGSPPPSTLVPPPKGITAAPSASDQLSTVSISASSRGKATRSG